MRDGVVANPLSARERTFVVQFKTIKPDAQYYLADEMDIEALYPALDDAREFTRLVRLESSRLLGEGKTEDIGYRIGKPREKMPE